MFSNGLSNLVSEIVGPSFLACAGDSREVSPRKMSDVAQLIDLMIMAVASDLIEQESIRPLGVKESEYGGQVYAAENCPEWQEGLAKASALHAES